MEQTMRDLLGICLGMFFGFIIGRITHPRLLAKHLLQELSKRW